MKNRNRMIVNCVTASLMYYWSLPALAEQSSSEIKIVRDEYGMPHIYANDTWHLFYGYGYVVAQDRLFSDGNGTSQYSRDCRGSAWQRFCEI
ncbi:penicillin acylase family protein [Escherichia coli]|nr:penicillin acylase family protein [Escherichia coli]